MFENAGESYMSDDVATHALCCTIYMKGSYTYQMLCICQNIIQVFYAHQQKDEEKQEAASYARPHVCLILFQIHVFVGFNQKWRLRYYSKAPTQNLIGLFYLQFFKLVASGYALEMYQQHL